MGTLAIAIERKEWELAALCLLLGVTQAAAALPPDAVEGLLELLEAPPQRPRPDGWPSGHRPSREERGGPGGRRR